MSAPLGATEFLDSFDSLLDDPRGLAFVDSFHYRFDGPTDQERADELEWRTEHEQQYAEWQQDDPLVLPVVSPSRAVPRATDLARGGASTFLDSRPVENSKDTAPVILAPSPVGQSPPFVVSNPSLVVTAPIELGNEGKKHARETGFSLKEYPDRIDPSTSALDLTLDSDDSLQINSPPTKKQRQLASKSSVAAPRKSKITTRRPPSKPMPTAPLPIDTLLKQLAKSPTPHLICPTISAFLSYSAPSLAALPKGVGRFKNCRIILIAACPLLADHLDTTYVFFRVGLMAKNGATLIRAEEFVPSTPEAKEDDHTLAEKERWTSHIILIQGARTGEYDFEKLLPLLGAAGLGNANEMGNYVKVVKWNWVMESLERGKQGEREFELRPDLRRSRSVDQLIKNVSRGYERGRPLVGVGVGAEREEEETREREITPFPLSQIPTKPYLAYSTRQSIDPAPPLPSPAATPIPSISISRTLSTAGSSFGKNTVQGLEAELGVVRSEGYSSPLKGISSDEEGMIYRDQVEDYETDEENEVRSRRGGKGVEGQKVVKRKGGFLCDTPAAAVAAGKSPNEDLARMLRALGDCVPAGDKARYKKNNYARAASAVLRHPTKIASAAQARTLDGVGAHMEPRIAEILRTGRQRMISQSSVESGVKKIFRGIYAVGSLTAEKWYEAGARTLEDIREERFGICPTATMRIGLRYYEDLQLKIPRDEVEELYGYAVRAAKSIDPQLQVLCMGSYRRGAQECGDIDLLVTRDPTTDDKDHRGMIAKLRRTLLHEGIIQHDLSTSEDDSALDFKLNALCRLPGEARKMRRLDILGVPWEELPAAMIYFTGNDHFNRSVRLKARKMGYSLNQIGLYTNVTRFKAGSSKAGQKDNQGILVPGIKSEQDIFRILKIKWIPPEERVP